MRREEAHRLMISGRDDLHSMYPRSLPRMMLNKHGSSITQKRTKMVMRSAVIGRVISPMEVVRDQLNPMRMPPNAHNANT